jgi:hypothetical protein
MSQVQQGWRREQKHVPRGGYFSIRHAILRMLLHSWLFNKLAFGARVEFLSLLRRMSAAALEPEPSVLILSHKANVRLRQQKGQSRACVTR